MTPLLNPDSHDPRPVLAVIFVLVAAGGIVDLILDSPEVWAGPHAVFEVLLILLSLAGAAHLGRGWIRAERSLEQARGALDERRDERDIWKRRARRLLVWVWERPSMSSSTPGSSRRRSARRP